MKIKEKINQWRDFFLDLVMPKLCLVCGQEKTYLCPRCLAEITMIDKFVCPICQKLSLYGKTCSACQKSSYLDGVFYALDYKNHLVQKMIKLLKYHYLKELIHPLAEILISQIKNLCFLSNNFVFNPSSSLIIPIPLHRKKFLWRGFNQSELLAQKIAEEFKLPFKNDLLFKVKNTCSQTDLKKDERNLNIKNVFALKNEGQVKNKIVFLIDDVITTGATLNEAARVLKKAGAQEIWGITLARD